MALLQDDIAELKDPSTAPDEPESKEQCRNGGWEDFGFDNQGQCVADVASDGRSSDGR